MLQATNFIAGCYFIAVFKNATIDFAPSVKGTPSFAFERLKKFFTAFSSSLRRSLPVEFRFRGANLFFDSEDRSHCLIAGAIQRVRGNAAQS